MTTAFERLFADRQARAAVGAFTCYDLETAAAGVAFERRLRHGQLVRQGCLAHGVAAVFYLFDLRNQCSRRGVCSGSRTDRKRVVRAYLHQLRCRE